MTADPLSAALEVAAGIVLARDRYAGPDRTVPELVRNRRDWLLKLIATSTALRAAARDACSGESALLLFHPDPEVASAAQRLLGTPPPELRKLRRATERNEQLRRRLQESRQRLEYAHQDIAALKDGLARARQAVTDAEEENGDLCTQLAAQQRRLEDPRALATALLTALSGASDPLPDGLLEGLRALVEPPRPVVQHVQERDLRVTPLGGDDHIGGSCLLIEAGDTSVLVDAGTRPGDPPEPPRDIAAALTARPAAVLVTHAHADHCGYVPALARRLPRLRIIGTPETCRLMPIMWRDSVKIMRHRAGDLRPYGGSWEPLYDTTAVGTAVSRLEELPVGVPRAIGDLTVELFAAGHILGAAGVVVSAGDRRVVVTGDISGFRQESVDGYHLPAAAREADLLIMESTCCAEKHSARQDRVTDLIKAVEEIHTGGGRVLIPAFALGRAQELALIMGKHLPHVPVLIDGMARELSTAFESAGPLKIFTGNVTPAPRPRDVTAFRTGVIITTSGMLTAGPAVEWARQILPDPNSAVFLSGYQDEESTGRHLLEQSENAATDFHLPGPAPTPLRARIAQMRLSAHADRQGLLEIAAEVTPHEIMLVHGLPTRQRAFTKVLALRNHKTTPTAPWHAP